MANEQQINPANYLVAKDVVIEPVSQGVVVIHIVMEDRKPERYRVSFAVKEYVADTVLKSLLHRMNPIGLPAEVQEVEQGQEPSTEDSVQVDKLFCYGCAHAMAEFPFPGRPSGERPCCFCIRNAEREGVLAQVKQDHSDWLEPGQRNPFTGHWYDGTRAITNPMDCYHSLDMLVQIGIWESKSKEKISAVAPVAKVVAEPTKDKGKSDEV